MRAKVYGGPFYTGSHRVIHQYCGDAVVLLTFSFINQIWIACWVTRNPESVNNIPAIIYERSVSDEHCSDLGVWSLDHKISGKNAHLYAYVISCIFTGEYLWTKQS